MKRKGKSLKYLEIQKKNRRSQKCQNLNIDSILILKTQLNVRITKVQQKRELT